MKTGTSLYRITRVFTMAHGLPRSWPRPGLDLSGTLRCLVHVAALPWHVQGNTSSHRNTSTNSSPKTSANSNTNTHSNANANTNTNTTEISSGRKRTA